MFGDIIQLLLLGIGWWLGKQKNNSEALKQFYKFVHTMHINHMSSVKAGYKWRSQRQKIALEIERRQKEEAAKSGSEENK